MSEKSKKLDNRIIAAFIIFAVYVVLNLFFPRSGDDWAWGSKIGIDRLNSFFADYNGRYAGNLLVIALTRSRIAEVLCKAATMTLCCILPSYMIKSRELKYVALSTFMMFLIPKNVLAQTVVWTSGFTNYVPPIVMLAVYYLMIDNIFGREAPSYKPLLVPAAFLIGFVGTLFMENLTILYVFIGIVILVYTRIRFKKTPLVQVAFLIGSVGGTAAMFTNGAYLNISQSKDSYRSTALDSSLVETVSDNLTVLVREFVCYNPVMVALLSLLCAWLCYAAAKKEKLPCSVGKLKVTAGLNLASALLLVSLYFVYDRLITVTPFIGKRAKLYLIFIVVGIYCLTLIIELLIAVRDSGMRDRIMLLILSLGVMTAPLLIVKPLHARNLMPMYFMTVVLMIVLLKHIESLTPMSEVVSKGVCISSAAAAGASFLVLLSVYVPAMHYGEIRDKSAAIQNSRSNDGNLYICDIPNEGWLWMVNPFGDSLWELRYKQYNHLDESLKIKFVSYKKYEAWCKEHSIDFE